MNVEVNKFGMWIDMPPEFFAKTRCKTMHVSTRYFYEALSDMLESDGDYRCAAMVRDAASSYGDDVDLIKFTDESGDPVQTYGTTCPRRKRSIVETGTRLSGFWIRFAPRSCP